jgi:hypothetical protein
MAFSNGTLLSSGGDVYTQLMAIVKTFMETAGWTTNLYEDYRFKYAGDDYTGKRLHSQKSIGGYTRYINIRSHKNQQIFDTTNRKQSTGISAIASTGYDGTTETQNIQFVTDSGGNANIFTDAANGSLIAAVGDTVTVASTGVYDGSHTVLSVAAGSPPSMVINTAFISTATGTVDVPSRWDKQTGFTAGSDPNLTDESSGCGAVDLPDDNLNYWLFSQNSDDNIYLICGNTTGYTGIVFGVTSSNNYFLSGASHYDGSEDVLPNGVLCGVPQAGRSDGVMALRKEDNTSWWDWPDGTSDDTACLLNMEDINTILETNTISSIVQQLLFCSPDNFKGNNPLIPSYQGVQIDNDAESIQYNGIVEGIKYVNMKFVDSLTELTFGGDIYILFRLYAADDANDATAGLAILK